MRRRALAIGGALALAFAGGFAWRRTHPRDAPRVDPAAPARAAGSSAAAGRVPSQLAAQTPDVAAPAALPGSLEGTEPDGAVEADAAGHLVVTIELRRLFDHFLAASGEEPVGAMRARIIAVLRQRLPASAADEAIVILDRYLAYRDAARALAPPSVDLSLAAGLAPDLAAGLAQIHDLRGKWFSPQVARAFFADEEAAIYAALARRDVAADPSLSAAERARRLAEIDARTPVAVQEARAAATAPVDEMNREAQLRAAGASDQQIAAARSAALGPDAAARLADLDRAHAAWDARLAQFRAARAAVLADPRLDAAERQRRIDELLARSFTAPERIRVEALDRTSPGSAPQ